jgi:DNA-binding NarL/FixJ family response regulator
MVRLQSCAAHAEDDRKRAKRLVQEGFKLSAESGTRPTSPIQRTGRLAARKQEIALPVGRGLTNRQIAQELSISERTAENHVGRILK